MDDKTCELLKIKMNLLLFKNLKDIRCGDDESDADGDGYGDDVNDNSHDDGAMDVID